MSEDFSPKEYFDLFLSFLKSPNNLTPGEIEGIRSRLGEWWNWIGGSASDSIAASIMESDIFLDGKIKSSPQRYSLLPVKNVEIFIARLTRIIQRIGFDAWLPKIRSPLERRLKEKISKKFTEIIMSYGYLYEMLNQSGLANPSRLKTIYKNLGQLYQDVEAKLVNHPLPDAFVNPYRKPNDNEWTVDFKEIIRDHIPGIKDAPINRIIKELLKRFGIYVEEKAIAQRLYRHKKQS
jgi:hypothetical protein